MKKIFALCLTLSTGVLFGQQCPQDFNIGNDTTLICNSSLTIQAPAGFSSYTWSTGAAQQSINVNQSGTYTCYANFTGNNLVANSDFSQGNTGFTSGYSLGTGGTWGLLSNAGTYTVNSSPRNTHNNFVQCSDHTIGNSTGSMMVVNGANVANVAVWSQSITVQPNTDYQFSFWGMTVTSQNPGILKFSINGTQVGNTLNLPTSTCLWQEFYTTWNSGSNTNIVISITNQNTQADGNDFAIDDIQFRPICTYSDRITVVIPPKPIIQASSAVSICEGTSTTLTASSSQNNLTYTWSPGGTVNSNLDVSPTATTTYSVIGKDENGCESLPKSILVTVNPKPFVQINGDSTFCFNGSTTLEAQTNIPSSQFLWSTDETSASIVVNNTSLISVRATSPSGCINDTSINVRELDNITTAINGVTQLCASEESSLTAVSSINNVSYTWSKNNSTNNPLTIDFNDVGWIFVTSTHPMCGTWKDSIQITLKDIPNIYPQEDQMICAGSEVLLHAKSDVLNANFVWFPGNLTGNNQTLLLEETTTFYVYAVDGNCVSTIDTFTIAVNNNCFISVPNVFTPNNDGVNDYFQLSGYSGIKTFSCSIVNRWGEEIQFFDDPAFLWNGKDKHNKEVVNGTYFYYIEYSTLSDEKQIMQGFVEKISN